MMLALIFPNNNNQICQIEQTSFPVADPLYWIECPDNCTTEWMFKDGSFLPPEVNVEQKPISVTKEELLAQIQALTDKINALS